MREHRFYIVFGEENKNKMLAAGFQMMKTCRGKEAYTFRARVDAEPPEGVEAFGTNELTF